MRLLTLLGGLGVVAFTLSGAGELSGRKAPGFSLPDSKFQFHDLADYRGRIVLLDIMKTSCPTCQKLSQTLERAKAKYGDKIAVLSVVNPPDDHKAVAAYVAKFGVTSPMLFDCGQMAGSYLKPNPQNPMVYLPHLFVIDRDGMIRADFGHHDTAAFEGPQIFAEIDRLLGGKGAPPESQKGAR
ncbi:MAG: TlpA family protein disulfide reductase [Bryobacteraceae bacterium]|nr:TlpA family protein disulfide reductase [Bryobacteraceae bacterium]